MSKEIFACDPNPNLKFNYTERIRLGMAVRSEGLMTEEVETPPSIEESANTSSSGPVSSPNNSNEDNVTHHTFTPICAMSIWQNNECQKIVSVPILLPSGVSEKSQSKVSMSEDGNQLEVEIVWPLMLSNVNFLHEFWNISGIVIPDSHPKIVGFHSFFQDMRKKDSDPIFSVGKINLPFTVNKSITTIKRIGDKAGTRIICAELTALEVADYLDKDTDDFCIL